MQELLNLQNLFYSNIVRKDDDLSFIRSNFPQERFAIYRSTIFENVTHALKLTYPGVWKLIGEECADSVAYAYCQQEDRLPKTGCLDDFGKEFPEFLSTIPQLSPLPYLRDYAHYEWLKHLAYMAPDSTPISPSDLCNIPEEAIDHVKFHFCPSVFLFESGYNLFDVHEIVQAHTANPIILKSENSYGLIGRKNNEIHTYWISPENWMFTKKLLEGSTLLKSTEDTECINNHFDLSSAIAFILQAQLIDHMVIGRG